MNSNKEIASFNRLASAVDQGPLSEETYTSLIRSQAQRPSPTEWREALRYWFLVLGSSLLAIGSIFFVAYNWDELGRFQKLGILELVLTGLFVGTLIRGLDSKVGHVLLTTASVMVGALLAVFSQIYQTGADSFELFLTWSLLILPWSLVARSNILWLLQLALINTTVWTYLSFNNMTWFASLGNTVFFLLILNVALGLLWSLLQKKYDWMHPGITEFTLALALAPATLFESISIIDSRYLPTVLLPLLIAILSLIVWRHRQLATMVSVSATLLSLGTAWLIKMLIDSGDWAILLIGVGILVQLGVIVPILSGIQRRNRESVPSDEVDATLAPTPIQDVAPIVQEDDDTLPWYVQVLIGSGAWFATLFITIFFILVLSSSEHLVFVYGLTIFLVTLKLQQNGYKPGFIKHSLLSGHLSATLILIFSLSEVFDVVHPIVALLGVGLFCTSIYFYSDSVGRFLFGCGAFTCSWWFLVSLWNDHASLLLFIATGVLVTWCSLNIETILLSRARVLFPPVFRAIVALFLFWSTLLIFYPLDPSLNMILSIGILLSCLSAIWSLNLDHYMALGMTLFAIVTYSVPSLIIAILVYGSAFLTRDVFIRAFAIIALLCSATFFYYSLEMTLFDKSILLLSNGFLLLILRLALGAMASEEDIDLAY